MGLSVSAEHSQMPGSILEKECRPCSPHGAYLQVCKEAGHKEVNKLNNYRFKRDVMEEL